MAAGAGSGGGESGRRLAEASREPQATVRTGGVLRIDVLTLFPLMFDGPFEHSIVARARRAGLIDLRVHDLRAWSVDKHRTADDYPFGGGGGMVLKPELAFAAVEELFGIGPISAANPVRAPHPVVIMSPQGTPFGHATAASLAEEQRIAIIAGHYEGYDERIVEHLATHEVSVGDFVVTGGEIPAMLVIDAVARLVPGVVGLEEAVTRESFADGLLEHPHYTRPSEFRGWSVPEVLLSGNHGEIARWRRERALRRTLERRPDLLDAAELTAEERSWIENAAGDRGR